MSDFDRMNAEQVPHIPATEELTLFPELLPQPRQRAARWSSEARYLRDKHAQEWRHIRRVLFALPAFSRQIILEQWAAKSARKLYSGSPRGFRAFARASFPYLLIE